MESINLKAYISDNNQIPAIKAFMKALKIKFEILPASESNYDPEFVKKIKKGDEDLKKGAGKKMSMETLSVLYK